MKKIKCLSRRVLYARQRGMSRLESGGLFSATVYYQSEFGNPKSLIRYNVTLF
jgi:hypothetical protein